VRHAAGVHAPVRLTTACAMISCAAGACSPSSPQASTSPCARVLQRQALLLRRLPRTRSRLQEQQRECLGVHAVEQALQRGARLARHAHARAQQRQQRAARRALQLRRRQRLGRRVRHAAGACAARLSAHAWCAAALQRAATRRESRQAFQRTVRSALSSPTPTTAPGRARSGV
jgi:hypothetical protein